MILQQNGAQIKALKGMSGVTYVTDLDAPRDPTPNSLILNTTGTMNQYFAWYGEFAPTVPGAYTYISQGQAVPTAVQEADYLGTLGAVNPSTLQWDTTLKPVLNDVTIRQACAMAINRATYFKVIDGSVGEVVDGSSASPRRSTAIRAIPRTTRRRRRGSSRRTSPRTSSPR